MGLVLWINNNRYRVYSVNEAFSMIYRGQSVTNLMTVKLPANTFSRGHLR